MLPVRGHNLIVTAESLRGSVWCSRYSSSGSEDSDFDELEQEPGDVDQPQSGTQQQDGQAASGGKGTADPDRHRQDDASFCWSSTDASSQQALDLLRRKLKPEPDYQRSWALARMVDGGEGVSHVQPPCLSLRVADSTAAGQAMLSMATVG